MSTDAIELRPYQVAAVDAVFREHESRRATLLVAATGCHVAGQELLMHDGSVKRVEDVVAGDRLMGPDSGPRTVLALARGEDDIVEVQPVKGDPWRVNRGHILTLARTARRAGDLLSGSTVDVAIPDFLQWAPYARHVHKLFRVAVEFERQAEALPLSPYFMGVVLGDGSMTERTLSVCKPDIEIRSACEETAGAFGCGISVYGEGTTSPSYRFTNGGRHGNPLVQLLDQFGLMGSRSADKFIPAVYKVASREERLQLLAGLLDTDGHLHGAGYDWISASRKLADDFCFVARSVGLAAYVETCQKGCQTGAVGTYYRVSVSGHCEAIPCRIPRKQAPARAQKKDVLRTGLTIADCGHRAPYFGFTLEGDGRYLLGDFTVTHNTGKTSCFAEVARRARPAGRVLVLAHRSELIDQAARRISAQTGLSVGIEMADRCMDRLTPPDVLVATVQTLAQPSRLVTFDPDEPSIACVAVARPTKSRAFYCQMVGRGTRLSPGKPDLLILDFQGSAGRHALISPLDILDGNKDHAAKAKAARKMAEDPSLDILTALDQASHEIAEEQRAAVLRQTRVSHSATTIDPFAMVSTFLGVAPRAGRWGGQAPAPEDIEYLQERAKGLSLSGLDGGQVAEIVAAVRARYKSGKASWNQARVLIRAGFDPEVSFNTASATIDMLASNRWRAPAGLQQAFDLLAESKRTGLRRDEAVAAFKAVGVPL